MKMATVSPTLDPYATLNIPHSASSEEIKSAFRKLARQYHPDKKASLHDNDHHDKDFADMAAAYELLSDPTRKAQYDHIHKYGGHDENNNPDDAQNGQRARKRKVGIGYVCHDPLLSFLFTKGKIRSTRAVCGIQIPSRQRLSQADRFQFAFSSGQSFCEDPQTGAKTYSTQTTHFTNGQRCKRTEKTVVHPDGLQERVVVNEQADGQQTRQYFVNRGAPRSEAGGPWYHTVWHEIQDKLLMCYGPCSVVEAQNQSYHQ